MTFEQFEMNERERSYERQLFSMIGEGEETIKNTIAVFYNFKREKISEDYITKMVKSAEEYVRNYFVVVGVVGKNGVMNVDKGAQTVINELNRSSITDPIRIQLFKDEDLMFNVLSHDLVPTHIIMSDDQKKVLLEKQ